MTQEEKDKIDEYRQRQKEWRDISVTQLSNTNNILLTLSSGLLAFCFDKNEITRIHIDVTGKISESDITFVLAIILLGISMTYGITVLISRLYDFRISRHLALSRQRFYIKYKKVFSDDDFGEFNFCHRIGALGQVLFCRLSFIGSREIKEMPNEKDLRSKFDKLRRTSDILGTASWIWTKYQVLYFLLSCLVYFTYLLF